MKKVFFSLLVCLLSSATFAQNSDSANFYYNKGIAEDSARLYAVAENDFSKAISFDPNFVEAYVASGKTNLAMRRITEAQGDFNKAYELAPENKEVVAQLMTLTFNNRQFQKAIDLAQKCNDCENASRVLGMSYYNIEDFGKAEKFLKNALIENGKDAEAAYTLGRTYLELEEEKNAIPQFENAVALEPTRGQWQYELGLIYYSQNDFKNSLKYFDLAASNGYFKNNDFYENYGFAQIYSGDADGGLKTLNIVMERKPNNKELLNNIAHAFYDTRKYQQALDYFTKILNLNPKDATTLYMAGLTFQKLGQIEKGKKICDHAIAMDPSLSKYRQKNEMPQGL